MLPKKVFKTLTISSRKLATGGLQHVAAIARLITVMVRDLVTLPHAWETLTLLALAAPRQPGPACLRPCLWTRAALGAAAVVLACAAAITESTQTPCA